MAYNESGGTVTLKLSRDDYANLLFMLGTALAETRRSNQEVFWRDIELVNRLNEGNPNYQAYEVPGKYKTDADRT